MAKRHIIEGEWTGYTSGQRHVVHREVTSVPGRIERLKRIKSIRFTDGTSLILSVTEARPREKIKILHGYDILIRDAELFSGPIVTVEEITRKSKSHGRIL